MHLAFTEREQNPGGLQAKAALRPPRVLGKLRVRSEGGVQTGQSAAPHKLLTTPATVTSAHNPAVWHLAGKIGSKGVIVCCGKHCLCVAGQGVRYAFI